MIQMVCKDCGCDCDVFQMQRIFEHLMVKIQPPVQVNDVARRPVQQEVEKIAQASEKYKLLRIILENIEDLEITLRKTQGH